MFKIKVIFAILSAVVGWCVSESNTGSGSVNSTLQQVGHHYPVADIGRLLQPMRH